MSYEMSTVVLVMNSIVTELKTLLDTPLVVYDPGQSYESALVRLKAAKLIHSEHKTPDVAFLAFTRSVVRKSEIMNSRSKINTFKNIGLDTDTPTATKYTTILGEFDFNYIYVSKNFSDIEKFEILSLAGELPKSVTANLGTTFEGTWTYQINWNDLEGLTVNIDETFYQYVSGAAKITGFFSLLDSNDVSAYKLLKSVYISLYSSKYSMNEFSLEFPLTSGTGTYVIDTGYQLERKTVGITGLLKVADVITYYYGLDNGKGEIAANWPISGSSYGTVDYDTGIIKIYVNDTGAQDGSKFTCTFKVKMVSDSTTVGGTLVPSVPATGMSITGGNIHLGNKLPTVNGETVSRMLPVGNTLVGAFDP